MLNRYILPQKVSRVDAMLTVDDDVLLTEGLLLCMLGQLRAHPDSIVGLGPRHVDPVTGNYMSKSAAYQPNVIIGKTMLMHRRLHRLVADSSEELRSKARRGEVCASCDDLVVNAIVSAATGVGPVVVESKTWPNVLMRLPSADGVSTKDRSTWYGPTGRRSQCVRYLMKFFHDVDELWQPKAVPQSLRCTAMPT